MSLLDKIEYPSDIKKLNLKELEILCSEIREYIIECCAKNPGHIGASLGAVEIAVAIHYVFDTPEDKVVWDVGHQAYAHKIITGRKEAFKSNRTHNGISGFPKMSESKYDTFGTGHSSTSISAALGMAIASEINNDNRHIIAVIGDGAMTGGMAFEGMNNAGSLKTDLLVILNDNQISIDKAAGGLHDHLLKISTSTTYNKIKNSVWEGVGATKLRKFIQKVMFSTKVAILKNGSLFESLGFRYFGTIDGNDIGQMVTTLSNLKMIKGPKLLHVATKKGKGYKPAEQDQVAWHAPGTFDPKTGKRTKKGDLNIAKYQDVFGETLLELARINTKIIGVTPAMATGCGMNVMMSEIPEQTFDVGIAEQHAVTFSAGLATSGFIPFCNIYSSFMQRGYDSVIHDVALQKLKVVFCLDRGGIVGEDGATHHGAFDMAFFRPIPNLTIVSPLDEIQLRNMLYSATTPKYGTTIIRYPRGIGEGVKWRNEKFSEIEIGKGQLLRDGKEIAILSIGPIGNRGKDAIQMAEKEGVSPIHYDMRFLKPIDIDALKDACSKASTIITLEDGSIIGGLHSAVSEYIAENKINCKVIGLGIPDRFIEQGTVSELYTDCGYNTEDIYQLIMKVHNSKEE